MLGESVGTGTQYHKLVLSLNVDDLRRIVLKQIESGFLCPTTLEPVQLASHLLGNHGTFELPEGLLNPEFLAEGGFGVVIRCTAEKPLNGYKGEIAVKRIALSEDSGDWEDTLRLLREIHFLKRLPHENITPLLHIYPNDGDQFNHIYMAMPCYRPGSLDVFSVDDIEEYKTIMYQSLRGLRWMHRHGVLHRDLKRENIFFDRKKKVAAIADLGMARTLVNRMTSKKGVGTRCYLAPEQLSGDTDYGEKVDMFAFGCVMYETLCQKPGMCFIPNSIAGGLEHRVRIYAVSGKREDKDPEVAEKAKKDSVQKWAKNRLQKLLDKSMNCEGLQAVILRLLAYGPKRRPTADNLMKEEFFQQVEDHDDIVLQPLAQESFDERLRYIESEDEKMKKVREWIWEFATDKTQPFTKKNNNNTTDNKKSIHKSPSSTSSTRVPNAGSSPTSSREPASYKTARDHNVNGEHNKTHFQLPHISEDVSILGDDDDISPMEQVPEPLVPARHTYSFGVPANPVDTSSFGGMISPLEAASRIRATSSSNFNMDEDLPEDEDISPMMLPPEVQKLKRRSCSTDNLLTYNDDEKTRVTLRTKDEHKTDPPGTMRRGKAGGFNFPPPLKENNKENRCPSSPAKMRNLDEDDTRSKLNRDAVRRRGQSAGGKRTNFSALFATGATRGGFENLSCNDDDEHPEEHTGLTNDFKRFRTTLEDANTKTKRVKR